MKKAIKLLPPILLLFFFFKCSYTENPSFKNLQARVINSSNAIIYNITLSMVGADETLEITELVINQYSDYHTFILPVWEGEIPDSWGDYYGSYTQKDTIKDMCIMNYEHNFKNKVTIQINDTSYSFSTSEKFF